jgi:CPA1 family monovalent cation:H+ antiporter
VSIFDVAAILIAVTALSGYVNHRFLRLPPTSGTLVVALVTSLVILALEAVIPAIELRLLVERFLGEIDFDRALMQGLLCFLLFAGALHVDLEGLLDHRWTIAALATLGVLISVTVVGLLTWLMFGLIGLHISLLVCLTFGALISPTDPIAVMGLLKELRGPKSLEAQIAGESLFNDGIGVVVFMALASMAQLLDAAPVEGASINVTPSSDSGCAK